MSTKVWAGNDSKKAREVCRPIVEQGGPCYRCRKPILPGQPWHADHIVPREQGGSDDPSNLWPAHEHCNTSDGGKRGAQITNARRRIRGSAGTVESFEGSEVAHARRLLSFSLPLDDLPNVTAEATILSPFPDDTDTTEAVEGAAWMGFDLKPQGVEVASVMNANGEDGHPLYETVVVEIPRRATKTTAVLATLLGRCLHRPGYRVANTAQDGLRARQKLKEVMTALRAAGFEEQGLGTLYFSNGTERIEFANTSVWKALPPDPGAFRSDAFDAVLIDEAGELPPEKADALMAGILPTQDTRPDSQTIVAGTPGLVRAGLLWDTLEQLRAGVDGVGGVVYEADEREVFLDLSDPDHPIPNLALLLRVHPGISSGLTTVKKVLSRIEKMGLEKWTREYLCQWPRNAAVAALDVEAWRACEAQGEPERPDKVGVAWDVDPSGEFAALVAAWRDPAGRAHFEVLAAGGGTDWLPREAREVQNAHRGAFGYDSIGQNVEVADRMQRPPFRLRLAPVRARDLVGAAARIEKEIHLRNVVHYGDPELTEAVEGAAWRPMGTDGRLFGRKASAASVAALVAASEALWLYDANARPQGERRGVVSAAELMKRRQERQRGAA